MRKNRIPTQKQWQTVIDKLYSVLPFTLERNDHLNMLEGEVNESGHKCGTVHCVGGWYAVAHWKENSFSEAQPLNFMNGANQLAADLGFDDESKFEEWADRNQTLWGNDQAFGIFSSTEAYAHPGQLEARSLIDVIHHFEFVKQRCLEYENSKKR